MTHDFHALTYATLGSFWNQTLRSADRPFARRLVRAPYVRDAASDVLEAYLSDGAVPLTNSRMQFDLLSVIQDGGSFDYRRRVNTGAGEIVFRPSDDEDWQRCGGFLGVTGEMTSAAIPLLATPTGEFLLFPGGNPVQDIARAEWLQQPIFLLPCDPDTEYLSFFTASKTLTAGLDFWRRGRNVLAFRDDPRRLFPEGDAFFTGFKNAGGAFRQVLATSGKPGPRVWAWVRGAASSFFAYQLAIAEAAGLTVIEGDGEVLFVNEDAQGAVTYVIGSAVYRVAYRHTLLTLGQRVLAGTIVGGGVEVLRRDTDAMWYRNVNWGSGLSLDALCPVQGVTVQDSTVSATVVSVTGGIRVEFPLLGSPAAVAAYWAHVRRMEDITGIMVADALPSLTAIDDATPVNPMEFFMTNMLGAYLIPVRIQLQDVSTNMQHRAEDFARANAPTGGVVVLV